jgi:hypothetical protein
MKTNQYHLPEHHPAALPEPVRSTDLPVNAQWLAGTGAGSWFSIQAGNSDTLFRIIRFSPEGKVECDRIFEISSGELNPEKELRFIYPSHCAICTILQYNKVITLTFINQ